jgi:hypothetical protein
LEAQNPDSNNALVHKTINFAALVKTALCNMTDGCYVSKAMAKYPKAPSSDLVRIYFYNSSLLSYYTSSAFV